MTFSQRLTTAVLLRKNPVVVGLDPRLQNLPAALRAGADTLAGQADAYGQFCREIIDVVATRVPAVKPQMAFFEQLGPDGLRVLAEVIRYARQAGLLVILDGKRNDIGSTAAAYAAAYLGAESTWQADALTVSPYLGDDSLTPFVQTAERQRAGLFVLVKTSNPGGRLLQDQVVDGRPVYHIVADWVAQQAEATRGELAYGDIGAVVGATYPQQLSELRRNMPSSWFLVPGFGAQGGTAADAAGAFDEAGLGAVINSSRAIIFAYERAEFQQHANSDWQRAVEKATEQMVDQLRAHTPAGKL